MTDIHNVIVIGSGSAGLTASLYLGRALLNPLCITGYNKLGLLMTTDTVDNYPGFPEGITGPELMKNMYNQAERFGTEFVQQNVKCIDMSKRPFKVTLVEGEVLQTKSIIIATGSQPVMLGLENEKKLIGKGISTCATCDAFFFRDEKIIVVGGGNSAIQEALFLSKFAREVTIIHRRNEFRATDILMKEALQNEKISFLTPYIVKEYLIEKNSLSGVVLKNTETGEDIGFECSGCFIFIGHVPNTKFLGEEIDLDEDGYIIINEEMMTSVNGIFASGDCHDKIFRQAITAAGDGCKAALSCIKFLEETK